jgi:hypothetical protein
MLVFASSAVLNAAPDDSLRRFSDKLLWLAGLSSAKRPRRGNNAITSDFLYLRSPTDDTSANRARVEAFSIARAFGRSKAAGRGGIPSGVPTL